MNANNQNLAAETPDERRARHLAAYDDNHDREGLFIPLIGLQDGTTPGCPECGLTASTPWAHSLACAMYSPHPNSIAAHHS